ncbi:MAG: YmaF [Anaerosporomusa subterranea]|nr:YmaF [Anaerosporomusa subterranea]
MEEDIRKKAYKIESDSDSDCDHSTNLTHVHEFLGSTKLAELEEDPHNHRFAGVSGQVISIGNNHHVHDIITRTDFYEDHFHEICVRSEQETNVGDGKHVHFVHRMTEEAENHKHEFLVATLIQDPIGD